MEEAKGQTLGNGWKYLLDEEGLALDLEGLEVTDTAEQCSILVEK